MARSQDRQACRRPDLADADLRPLSGLRRLCRKQQPVCADVRSAGARSGERNSRRRMPKTVRAQYRDQHAGAGRPRARASRCHQRDACVDPRRSALSPGREGVGATGPWQPCRRDRDFVVAGAGARSRGHAARRGEPRGDQGYAGAADAVESELAELQPLRQLWRSDSGDVRQGRDAARRYPRRPQRARRGLCREDICRQPGSGHRPKLVAMRNAPAFRWIVAGAVIAALLASAISYRADAQSEYMRGDRMPYDAFDRLAKTDLEIAGGAIHVAFAPGDIALPREKVMDWIRMSARAVSIYYGRFPVTSLRLLLVPVEGGRIRGGTTWGYRGAAIRIPLGRDSTEEVLKRDWVMVHEMVHTALPDLDQRYGWLSEGLAVYIEPIARVQAGDLAARAVWQDIMRDMPKGLPESGDQGLDNTDTWGRRYWGGAMFCLLADIEIRKRTGNRLGLQDAMRGVIAAGGNHEKDWPLDRLLSTADKAVGVDVLARLHNEMGPKPVAPDLAALWRDLGLKSQGVSLEFDDAAPLAAIRKAITEPRAG